MKTAAFIFALAAVGGLTLAGIRMSGTEIPPTWMAVGHGLVAAAALVSLMLAAAQYGLPPLGKAALVVFVLAAVGGAFIFLNYHLNDRALPIPLILLHGGAAVVGFGLLLAAVFVPQRRRL